MALCLIGLGSNLGNRASLLDDSIARIDETPHVRVVSKSRFHETPPIGGPAGQGAFLNAAILVETVLTPEELLNEVGKIESDLGRRRAERWGPRPIDLDLLLYDDVIVATERLQLPHPRMSWRRFVLAPAAEVASDMRHPAIGWTVRQLLDHLDRARPYVAVTGPAGAGKQRLAQAVADRLQAFMIADPVRPSGEGTPECKSYGVAPGVELKCAKRRAEAVEVDSPIWNSPHLLWISDFWVGQSAATIRVLSEEAQCEALLERFHHVTKRACPPKLTVLLDAPPAWCAENLVDRGAPRPDAKALRMIDAIRQALMEQVRQPGRGPVVELNGQRPAEAADELTAAVLAMR